MCYNPCRRQTNASDIIVPEYSVLIFWEADVMKKFLASLMVFVLLMTLAVSSASAGRLMDSFRGLKEKIESSFAGNKEEAEAEAEKGKKSYKLEHLVTMLGSYVKDYCNEKGIDPSEALSQVTGMITDQEGGISLDSVLSLLSMLGVSGGSSYITEIENEKAAVNDYYLAKYQDEIAEGDVPIVYNTGAINFDIGPAKTIVYLRLVVYTPDGADLKQKFFADSVELLSFDVDEESNYTLAESVVAEPGDDLEANIAALCEQLGITYDDFYIYYDPNEIGWSWSYHLEEFLQANPEYERIEYEGELKTLDEITRICDDYMDLCMAKYQTEEPAEEAAEETK